MQCIYNYIPKTKHVTTVYNVAAVLYLQFVLHVMLLSMLNMLCTFTSLLLLLLLLLLLSKPEVPLSNFYQSERQFVRHSIFATLK